MSLELSAASSPELVKDGGITGDATGQQQVKLELQAELPLAASAQPQPELQKGLALSKSAQVVGESSGITADAIFPTFRANIKGTDIGSTTRTPDSINYGIPGESRSEAQSSQKDEAGCLARHPDDLMLRNKITRTAGK